MSSTTAIGASEAEGANKAHETPDGDLWHMAQQLGAPGGWQGAYADALWREILRLSTAHHTALECCAKIADRAAKQYADNESRSAMAEEIAALIRASQNTICTWCGSDIHCGAAECGFPKPTTSALRQGHRHTEGNGQ